MNNKLRESFLFWCAVMLISVLVWLVPSASLFNAVIDSVGTGFTMVGQIRHFSWVDMAKIPMGNVGSRALAAGGCWVALICWLYYQDKSRGQLLRLGRFIQATLLTIISTTAVLIIATAYFSDQHGYVEVIFSTLPAEVFVVGLVVKHLFPEWIEQNRQIGILKAITASFTGLTALKVLILLLMPGITIRPF